MKAKYSRPLVIDACVAGSAGTTDYPTSRACRDFLEAVLKICHRAVFSPELVAEWNRHQSGWAERWRSTMVAKKKVDRIGTIENAALRAEIDARPISEKQREEIRKDAHLVEAALQTDQTVISSDENTARQPFREIAANVPSIGHLIWVNPTRDDERAIEWLQSGAPAEPSRRLRGKLD